MNADGVHGWKIVNRVITLKIPKALLILNLVPLVGCASNLANCESDRSVVDVGHSTGNAIASPLGHFIYVKGESYSCAIRFTDLCRAGDQVAPTRFTNGIESISQKFAVYHQPDGSDDFRRSNVVVSEGRVSQVPSGGFGWHGSGSSGNQIYIPCGGKMIAWLAPGFVTFSVKSESGKVDYDQTLRLAPTGVREIKNVDFTNPALVWYSVSRVTPPEAVQLRVRD